VHGLREGTADGGLRDNGLWSIEKDRRMMHRNLIEKGRREQRRSQDGTGAFPLGCCAWWVQTSTVS